MDIIQICSAGYVLAIGVAAFLIWGKFVITGKHTKVSFDGWPAFVWFVATIVCAVTTLVQIG